MRYWKRVDAQGETTTVEKYSHNLDVEGAIEIKEAEYDAFIASLPPPPDQEPRRDFGKEIDELKAEILNLKAGS